MTDPGTGPMLPSPPPRLRGSLRSIGGPRHLALIREGQAAPDPSTRRSAGAPGDTTGAAGAARDHHTA